MARSASSSSEVVTAIALIFGAASGFIVLMAISTILNGWVLSILWGWFVAPVFGLPAIGVGNAIGLATVVSYLTYHYIDTQPNSDKSGKWSALISITVLRPLFTLFFGYIVYLFI